MGMVKPNNAELPFACSPPRLGTTLPLSELRRIFQP